MSRSKSTGDELSQVKRALLTIERLESRIGELEARAPEPIAVVGMACRFPGGADSPEALWTLLREGRDAIGEIPADRTQLQGLYDPDPEAPGKMYMRRAGFLDQVDGFDAEFFRIPAREAAQLDPQQRLFLEVTWEALENARIPPDSLREGRTGVFAGMLSTDYAYLPGSLEERVDAHYYPGVNRSFLAGRLSHFLGLQGESLVVDTACSTSLVAVHLACRSLAAGDSEIALAGGVNLLLSPETSIYLCKAGAMSPSNVCRAFDAAADGLVRGEGCGVVVLKRLSDALIAGDPVLAVIRGSAVNHDGPSGGLTVPNLGAQEKLYRQAQQASGVEAPEVSYVEAHGTGTNLGDPVELQGLAAAYCEDREAANPLWIGSVKTNIGHTDSAAGVAGLMKVILSLRHGEVPPSLNFEEPNPAFSWDDYPLRVAQRCVDLPESEAERLAGVSSFGLSGINAHVLVQGYGEPEIAPAEAAGPYLLTVSARSPEAREDLARAYGELLGAESDDSWAADVTSAALWDRAALDHRLAVVAPDRAGLVEQLEAFVAQPAEAEGATGEPIAGEEPRIVFLCSGQGGQWWAMGRELLAENDTFRRTLERIDEIFTAEAGWSLLREMGRDEESSRIHDTEVAQPAIFAMQVGLAEIWQERGIRPDAVVGHSLGEAAAAYLSRGLSLEDAVRVIHHRSRLLEGPTGEGKMMSVGLSPEEAENLVADYADRVSIAVYNSPYSVVLSGEEAAMDDIDRLLTEREVFHRELLVKFASHCPQVEPYQKPLEEALAGVRPRTPEVPLFSTVTGAWIEGEELDARYWATNIRAPVRFAQAIQELAGRGYETFLEVDPHPILAGAVEQCLEAAGASGRALGSLHRERPESLALAQSAAALWAHGTPVDLSAIVGPPGAPVRLPTYPWQRRRYWLETDTPSRTRSEARPQAPLESLLGSRLDSPLPQVQFSSVLRSGAPAYLRGHQVDGRVAFPATGTLELMLAATREEVGSSAHIADVELHKALILSADSTAVQTTVDPQEGAGARLRVYAHDRQGGTWTHLASCTSGVGESGSRPQMESLEVVRERCRPRDVEEFYRSIGQFGYEYSGDFRCVRELWVGEAEALAQVEIESGLLQESLTGVHPALLDGCLQAGLSLLTLDAGGPVYVPVRIAAYQVLRTPGSVLWSHCTSVSEQVGGARTLDVRLFDEAGLVGRLEGLELQPVDSWDVLGARGTRWCYEKEWWPLELAEYKAGDRDPWVVFADSHDIGAGLVRFLESRPGQHVVVRSGDAFRITGDESFELDPTAPGDLHRLLEALTERGMSRCRMVYLWGLDVGSMNGLDSERLASDQKRSCGGLLHLLQACVNAAEDLTRDLWIVTRGAQAVDDGDPPVEASQASLWGMGRVIRLEHPEVHCVSLDLDPAAGDQTGLLVREVQSNDDERELAFRQGRRRVARLVESRGLQPASPVQSAQQSESESPRQLRISEFGVIDNLAMESIPRHTPSAGEVEIQVRSAGLNFKDVLRALGMIKEPWDYVDGSEVARSSGGRFGYECSGVVSAVGDGVETFRVGQEVLAGLASGCFGDFVVVDERYVAPKPEVLSFHEAATIPITFLTAYYALHRLADMQAGEKVLIHAAAGGVGQAAVQLALRAGATVFATASVGKHDFVRSLGVSEVMDSRTLDFAEQIKEKTEGTGVDVVLNSLSGEFAEKSLEVCAPEARFVEIGQIGILEESVVATRRPDVTYNVFDLGVSAAADPEGARDSFRDLVGWIEAGELAPLPFELFDAENLVGAFRHMARARHLGKIVIEMSPEAGDVSPRRPRAGADTTDGTYLVTGGLGALGLEVATWLAERGASRLVLAGRSEPSTEAQRRIGRLREGGVEVLLPRLDVSQLTEVEAMVDEVHAEAGPIHGVVHAALALDDGVLVQQNLERFAKVFAAKVLGSWNLHLALSGEPLDFFVGFSSTVGLLGSPGQGNYAAASAFLDALAHRRRAEDRCGLSINWGPWGEVGQAARLSDRDRARWASRGIEPIPPEQGLEILELLMDSDKTQVGVLPVDWGRYTAQLPVAGRRLYEALVESAETSAPAEDEFEHVRQAPVDEQLDMLVGYLRSQVARILGLAAPERIHTRRRLFDLGLDSLTAMELKNRLEASVGSPLRSTVIFDYPTIEALSQHLLETVLADESDTVPAEPEETVSTDLDDLTPDEVADLLAQELTD